MITTRVGSCRRWTTKARFRCGGLVDRAVRTGLQDGVLVSHRGDLTIVSLAAQRVVRTSWATRINRMRLSMLRWRGYVLVAGVMLLLLVTFVATWLATT